MSWLRLKKMKQPEEGFTLPELLTVIVVSTLIMTTFMLFFVTMLQQYVINDVRADILAEAHVALDTITEDVRLSGAADETNRWPDEYNPEAPDNTFGWHSSDTVLVLALVAEDAQNSILFDDPAQYISHKNNVVYFVTDQTLYRRVLAAPVDGNVARSSCPQGSGDCPADRSLATQVTDFSVRYLDGLDNEVDPTSARSVEVSITIQKDQFSKTIEVAYKTRMVFRNV